MAKLSAHGRELGRIERLRYRVAYMSDGKILRNTGAGWKLWKKCNPGVDPADHWAEAKARHEARLQARPCLAYYMELLHDFPLDRRGIIDEAVGLLANDLDGLWSELNDAGVELDLGDAGALCEAYSAAMQEQKMRGPFTYSPTPAAAPVQQAPSPEPFQLVA